MVKGQLVVIRGPMGSGKTKRLISECATWRENGFVGVAAFKHAKDRRYDAGDRLSSHDGQSVPAVPVWTATQAMYDASIRGCDLVVFDEGQFFESDLLTVALELVRRGCRVVVAGLKRISSDRRRAGEEIPLMKRLWEMAQVKIELFNRCARCGAENAEYSQRIGDVSETGVAVISAYEPRCAACFEPGK